MLFTTLCSVGMMTVSKMAPQSDLVSCSVLKHCLMMMPISCVVFLQKAAGLLFLSPRARPSPLALLPQFPCAAALNHVRHPPACVESACVSSPLLTIETSTVAGVPSSCHNRQTYKRWLGQVGCNRVVIQVINGRVSVTFTAQPALERLRRRNRPRKCTRIHPTMSRQQ